MLGFYDSGLGGIKVLKDALDMGLKGTIYFLADLKNNPYGTKSAEYLKTLANKNIKTLISKGVNTIVIACNTATSVAINDLRKTFPTTQILGIEPALKQAYDENLGKKILVLGTSVTVSQSKLKSLIEKLNCQEITTLISADKLVKLVEDKNFKNNKTEIEEYLKELFKPYNLKEYSHIVLGCTHFPIAKDYIRSIVGNNIKIIDGAIGLIKNLLTKIDNKENNLTIHILTTEYREDFNIRVKEILTDVNYEIEII